MNLPWENPGPVGWSIAALARARTEPGVRGVLALWLLLTLASVATGLLNVYLGWNGLSTNVLGLPLSLTVYPPFVIGVLLAIWLGPAWGAIPLYAANLASAMASGMAIHTSALFALAGPVEITVLWGSMVLLNVHPGLPTWRDRRLFLMLGLIAPTASSLASPIWNAANGLDLIQGQHVWRGWVLGDFLQVGILAAPLLYLVTSPVQRWLQDRFGAAPHPAPSYRTALPVVVLVFTMLGLLVFVGVESLVETLGISPDVRTPAGEVLNQRLIEIGAFLGVLFVVLLMTTVLFTAALVRRGETERELAHHDSLTGCLNRRAFKELFVAESSRSTRFQLPLSLMMLDGDNFKTVNDRFGHHVGDRVLRELSRRIRGVIRETDHLFRWGGEEFVLLLPHTDPEQALALAERIRSRIAESPLADTGDSGVVNVTVSIGVAGHEKPPFDDRELLHAADQALYRAKSSGRDQVAPAG